MVTHSSALAWRIPGTGEPGGLPSTGSHSVGHDGSDLAAAAAKKDLVHQGNRVSHTSHIISRLRGVFAYLTNI